MTFNDWIMVIDGLTEAEQEAFSNICVNLDQGIPLKITKLLTKKGLIERVEGGFACSSIPVHYAWCRWCSKKLNEDLKK